MTNPKTVPKVVNLALIVFPFNLTLSAQSSQPELKLPNVLARRPSSSDLEMWAYNQ